MLSSARAEGPSRVSPGPAPRDKRVLVVDDDPDLARMLRSLVASWGYEPVVVSDGTSALAELTGPRPPPRVLLDWMMPGASGLDVLRAHRRAGGRSHVVLCTARDAKDDVVAGLEAGADDYVVKPFDMAELRARLFRHASEAAVEPTPVACGTVIAGKYRLEARIGEGGMGTVWRATHLALGQTLAIKMILPAHAENALARARFEAEAKLASQIQSPYLVSIFDYGVTPDGWPYLVMEHLRGRTLRDVVAHDGPVSLPFAAAIASQIARGISAAHAAGVIHRDVKPDNVFLEDLGHDSMVGIPFRAKLIDFGIARGRDTERMSDTRDGGFIGTLGYASPEQLLGSATPASDVWALGATILYALTGRGPIAATQPGAMMVATTEGKIRLPRSSVPELPAALDAWAKRACAIDEETRFPDALTLARELRAIVSQRQDTSWLSIVPPPPATKAAPAESPPVQEAKPAAPAPVERPRVATPPAVLVSLVALALLALAWVVAAIEHG